MESKIVLCARKGQQLLEHVKLMLDFTEKCYFNKNEFELTARRLGIDASELREAIIVAEVFHDIGKIFFHSNLNVDEKCDNAPNSYRGHEVLSSFILNTISDQYRVFEYDTPRAREGTEPECIIQRALKYSVHLSIIGHHEAMGYQRRSHASSREVYEKFLWFKKRTGISAGEAVEGFLSNVLSGTPINLGTLRYDALDDEDLVRRYLERFVSHVDSVYNLHNESKEYLYASAIATRVSAVLMMADNFSAAKGSVKNKKMFLDFDSTCTMGRDVKVHT
ncbi:hypothetical protein [Desulfurococcus mucosus]|uniref:HD domain-containing protein n=1 Tax=Desulfurococcus mucosus (strain ATCC 35584 / DSM 2162 / JCM 9187 / O7/1) TaxID=765177 RepID=E8R9X4_DESM0|nr:hypothetical protein [Desulfurococcus mucosus]ADV65300.1 hypothetical protein Desmu_0998 [Desulfurococcus mucosus DSM 2162]